MSFPGDLLPGMSTERIKLDCFMQIHGGRLYGIKNIDHMLYETFILPKGLKPSVARPSLTFQLSNLKSRCIASKCFQAGESAGCRSKPSLVRPSSCHLMSGAVLEDMNSLWSLLFKGKWWTTFWGTLWTRLPSSPTLSLFHLLVWHTRHDVACAYCYLNSMQSYIF